MVRSLIYNNLFLFYLILDNMLSIDIYNRAKKLHIATEARRIVFLIETKNEKDDILLRNMECVARLYRVFCNDSGGTDIVEAQNLATILNNEILLAQVYKCADLFSNC